MRHVVHDLQPEIVKILRDGIQDGLIRGIKLRHFDKAIKTKKGPELEDYLQELWDRYPEGNYRN